MRVPEWLCIYAKLEEADGLELAPKQLREVARRYEAMEVALENIYRTTYEGATTVLSHKALVAARAPLLELI